jgi:hypothetical protein
LGGRLHLSNRLLLRVSRVGIVDGDANADGERDGEGRSGPRLRAM